MSTVSANSDAPDHKALSWVKSTLMNPRFLLALKASLAVGIAWLVAPFMPGVADEYPYYAPLGALLSMHSTLLGSAKYGLQILGGLALGILLAAGVLLVGDPNLLTISLVVAVGVLLGNNRWLGAPGQEYLPIAALFVLIVGGQDAGGYSIGYLVQMSVGVAVGLGVNLLILPPLTFDTAVLQFSRFRVSLAKHLSDVGEALTESWPPEREDWATQNRTLSKTTGEVREAIHNADESRKGNPRAHKHGRDLAADYGDLAALENITFYIRDVTEVLAGAVWGKPFPVELPAELCPPLSGAMHGVAAALKSWDAGVGDMTPLAEADDALEELMARLDEHRDVGVASLSAAVTIAMALKRVIASIRSRVEHANTLST